MKDYNENKESSYLKYQDINHFHGWEMSQKFPVNFFKWIGDISKFEKRFYKTL